MSECICSSCRNLKGEINEEGNIEQYSCEYGFPSPDCEECEGSGCEAVCSNYISDEEQAEPRDVTCKGCGKVLKQVCTDEDCGEVYCIDCYLSRG